MVFPTNGYGDIEIVEYINSNNVIVRFEDGSTRKTHKVQIVSGKVRNKNLPGPSNAASNPEKQLRKLKDVHGDTYDYSKTVYTRAQDKITITCRKHDDFQQTYSDHAAGKGCPECARARTTAGSKARSGKNTSNVIAEFVKVHGDRYDYSESVYVDSKTKIKIICKKHGPFYQVDKVHSKGHGCMTCRDEEISASQVSNTVEYVAKCVTKYGDKYDYSLVEYSTGHGVVTIGCKEGHGPFRTRASTHLHAGTGCPRCNKGGFDSTRPAYLYLMYSGDITKIGITNRSVEDRLKEINFDSGHKFEVISAHYFDDGFECSNIETRLLRYLRSKYKNPIKKFGGSSECFFEIDREEFKTILATELKGAK